MVGDNPKVDINGASKVSLWYIFTIYKKNIHCIDGVRKLHSFQYLFLWQDFNISYH
jgi:hypothetical protein